MVRGFEVPGIPALKHSNMGCDIHMHVEFRRKGQTHDYQHFVGPVNLGRHYGVFGALANVRCDGPAPKGLPDNLNWITIRDNSLSVSDKYADEEGFVSTSKAQKWVDDGYSQFNEEKTRVTHPDWHSHSWANVQDFEKALSGMNEAEEYHAMLAAMKSFEEQGYDVRAVYWFDN